ncbi:MAG: hypothetical protein JWL72_4435 [Ilumatobacteraceae bacterium]|nr:hypothetical protein [Ilumatobacteraceae bacterium]
MAVPRVFVSSTYFDLRHIRASLDGFISSLGFETVLSEKGDIAYAYDRPLDESCYAEVSQCDILLLIVGGRYGSAASDETADHAPEFLSRYDSITRREFQRAVDEDRPVWILVEANVMAEYQTYKVNRGRVEVRYAHVDSINVFELLDSIVDQSRNNPTATFQTFGDIEEWLRRQWAGLFGDLLRRRSTHAELASLAAQVNEMKDLNHTFKTYLEKVVQSVAPTESQALIVDEDRKLATRRRVREAAKNNLMELIGSIVRRPAIDIVDALTSAHTMLDLFEALVAFASTEEEVKDFAPFFLDHYIPFKRDLEELRTLLELPDLEDSEFTPAQLEGALRSVRSSSALERLTDEHAPPPAR